MTEGGSATGPASRPAPGRARIVLLIAAVAAVVGVAFGAATILGGPGRQVETGIVVAVQATSLTNVEGFSIRTADGRTVAFRVTSLENAATFPPGHLAEHKVTLATVRVTFIADGAVNRAVRVEDAP
ncbi:MAG: hypothetical protein M3Q66_03460 [Chloroflexota bacterium]|nr:hypothetical protein [Chloroflexota bacterium]